MAVGDTHMFLGFLTQVLTQLSSQSRRLLSTHASPEVRAENTPERKPHFNRTSKSQPPVHESDTLTAEPPGTNALCQHFLIFLQCFCTLSKRN